MNATVCGVVSTLTEKLSWLYQQREWSRQELLLIALGVLLFIFWMLRRRQKKTARPVHPEHLADFSSVIGTHLSDRGHGRRRFGQSRKGLPANVSAKHAKPVRAGNVARQDQKPDGRVGRSQWEASGPRQSGGGFKAKVPARVGAGEWFHHEAGEAPQNEGHRENRAVETVIAETSGREVAHSAQVAGGPEQPAMQMKAPSEQAVRSEQAQSALVEKIDELTVANERLVYEAGEHGQVQDHFEARLAELTAVNEQLQRQIGELKTGGPKKRVYAYEDEHRVVDNVRQKLCRKCGVWKDESEFHKNASRKDGLARWCKVCKVGASRESRARRASPNQ